MTKRSRRSALAAASAAALGAASLSAAPVAAAPMVEETQVIVVAPEGTAAVADRDADGALVPSESHRKWAFGLALGGLVGGIVGIFGFNALLNAMTRTKEAAVRLARRPARLGRKSEAKALSASETVVSAAVEAGRETLGVAFGLSAAGVLGLALLLVLDVSWKTGLVIGVVSAFTGGAGLRRLLRRSGTPAVAV